MQPKKTKAGRQAAVARRGRKKRRAVITFPPCEPSPGASTSTSHSVSWLLLILASDGVLRERLRERHQRRGRLRLASSDPSDSATSSQSAARAQGGGRVQKKKVPPETAEAGRQAGEKRASGCPAISWPFLPTAPARSGLHSRSGARACSWGLMRIYWLSCLLGNFALRHFSPQKEKKSAVLHV